MAMLRNCGRMGWVGWVFLLSAVKAEVRAQGVRDRNGDRDGKGGRTNGEGGDRNRTGSGGGSDGRGGFGDGRRKFGNRFRNGRKGGRFRNGGASEQQQNGDQSASKIPTEGYDDLADGDADGDISLLTTTPASPSNNTSSTAPPEALFSLLASSPLTASFENPTSIADAFPGLPSTLAALASPATLAGIPYVAPTAAPIANLSSFFAPEPSSSTGPPLSLPTSRLTRTISSTVYVTSSPTSLSAEGEGVASQASSLAVPPVSSEVVQRLSVGGKAGLGVGIALGVLAVLGVMTWVIRLRRGGRIRGERVPSETGSQIGREGQAFGFAGLFGRGREGKEGGRKGKGQTGEDAEWIIEDAERLEVNVVRKGSVRSVGEEAWVEGRAVPRSRSGTPPKPVSRASEGQVPGEKAEMEVVRVGMTVGERGHRLDGGLTGMALGSNPPVSPSAFPEPPPRKEKTGSWPLAD